MWLRFVGYKECVHNFCEETPCERAIGRQKWRILRRSYEDNLRGWKVHRNRTENCPVSRFGICGTETSSSPTRELFSETKAQVKIGPPMLYGLY